MYVEIFNRNLIIREWLNGSLVPLTLNLSFVLAVYLWSCYCEARAENKPFSSIAGIQTVCALFWVFSAESFRAIFVWFALRLTNDGHAMPQWLADFSNVMLIAGAFVLVSAVLRCTYIFSPPRFRSVFWIYSLTVTIVFLMVSHMFPQYPQL